MRSVSPMMAVLRSVLHSSTGLILFLEVDLGSGQFARLVRDSRNREADGHDWQRCDLKVELGSESSEGSLEQATFTLSNVSRVLSPYVMLGTLNGRPLRLMLAAEDQLDEFEPNLTFLLEISSSELNGSAAVFTCGHPGSADRAPKEIFTRQAFPQMQRPVGSR